MNTHAGVSAVFKRMLVDSEYEFDVDRLYDAQWSMAHFIQKHKRALCVVDMGLGKTVAALTSVWNMAIWDDLKILVIAPKSVALDVWPRELQKWHHLDRLRFSVATGKPRAQRNEALVDGNSNHIHIINRDNVVSMIDWLRSSGNMATYDVPVRIKRPNGTYRNAIRKIEKLPYDMVIIDESSSFKDPSTKRWKALSHVIQAVERVVLLTGTPTSQGLQDLWSQVYLLDGGARLGRSMNAYKYQFFHTDPWNEYKLILNEGAEDAIHDAIKDLVFRCDFKSSTDIPDVIYSDVLVKLPKGLMAQYVKLKHDFVLKLQSGEITAFNAAAASMKLQQFCNGAVYETYDAPEDIPKSGKAVVHVHDLKLEALDDLIEQAHNASDSVIVVYKFISDRQRFEQRYTSGKWKRMGLRCGGLDVKRWESKGDDKLDLMWIHPKCLHGNTEVLTEHRGWVKITDVLRSERVYDGVEFVTHDGCQYSGYQSVTEVFGITMTPDHTLLIENEWRQAKDVKTDQNTRQKAIFKGTIPDRSARHVEIPENGHLGAVHQKADVYDLVNCGPRHRFLIRNNEGEAYISHNSCGHGLNLQFGGHIMLWYGLDWSLELWQQTCARLPRLGQEHPVVIKRLLVEDTIDILQKSVLGSKHTGQVSLLKLMTEGMRD